MKTHTSTDTILRDSQPQFSLEQFGCSVVTEQDASCVATENPEYRETIKICDMVIPNEWSIPTDEDVENADPVIKEIIGRIPFGVTQKPMWKNKTEYKKCMKLVLLMQRVTSKQEINIHLSIRLLAKIQGSEKAKPALGTTDEQKKTSGSSRGARQTLKLLKDSGLIHCNDWSHNNSKIGFKYSFTEFWFTELVNVKFLMNANKSISKLPAVKKAKTSKPKKEKTLPMKPQPTKIEALPINTEIEAEALDAFAELHQAVIREVMEKEDAIDDASRKISLNINTVDIADFYELCARVNYDGNKIERIFNL